MRRLGTALLTGLALLVLMASSAAPAPRPERAPVLPSRVTDAAGDRITVRNASRIVVLNGDVAEVVFALGLGGRVVGTDTSATYPAAAARLQRIGYQRTLSAEGILSLRPTVVIGNTTAGPASVIKQIRDAGVTTVILPDDDRVASAWQKIRNVGRALGVPNRAARLAAITRTRIQAAQRRAARSTSRPKVAMLYIRGSRVQLLGGKGSRGDVMIAAARGRDVGAELGITGFQPITAESLVAAAPEVLLVPQAGLDSVGGIDGLLRIPGVAQTPAGRNRRVLAFDDQYLLGIGPRTGAAIRDLSSALHPELLRSAR
ncbi:MAG: ABC transporter substrate-binding protein [Thermoleophilia bacterium]|nr:ABC transporter substrate-binding protein [Thermoleophilia bacterium]